MDRTPAPRPGTGAADRRRQRPGGVLNGWRGALVIAGGGAVLIAALNVILAVTTGLVAVAAIVGYLVGGALRGRAAELPPAAGGAGVLGTVRGRGAAISMAIAVGAVLAGALATWLVAVLLQEGRLGPVDYLAEAMGALLAAQVLAAAGAAWLGGR